MLIDNIIHNKSGRILIKINIITSIQIHKFVQGSTKSFRGPTKSIETHVEVLNIPKGTSKGR